VSPEDLDLARLAQIQGLGEHVLAEVMGHFLRDGEGRVLALREAARQGDVTIMGELAHGLKGEGATVGALALADTCGRIEDLLREGDTAGARLLVADAAAAFERAARALRDLDSRR